MVRYVTNRCDSAHDHGERLGADAYPCEAVRYNDGTMDKTCGEPCSWVMGKGGHGKPPWQTNPDGTRFDPSIPDKT